MRTGYGKLLPDISGGEDWGEFATFHKTHAQGQRRIARGGDNRIIPFHLTMDQPDGLSGCKVEPGRACQLDFKGFLGEPMPTYQRRRLNALGAVW